MVLAGIFEKRACAAEGERKPTDAGGNGSSVEIEAAARGEPFTEPAPDEAEGRQS